MVSLHRRLTLLAAGLTAISLLGGCTQAGRLQTRNNPTARTWQGRMAMRVESNPVQSFTAGLELTGDAQAGELILSGPLGTTLLAVVWLPGQATLQRNGQTRQFDSVSALMQEALGADLPLSALFAWLSGDNAVVAGWQADLSQLGSGRLSARRNEPEPVAELRLMLEP